MLTNPEIIAALFAGAVSVLGAFFAFSRWMISKFLSELRPNSGSSMKDQITRLEKRVDDIYTILAENQYRPKVKKKESKTISVELLPEVQPSLED
jgi:hypothetical protein